MNEFDADGRGSRLRYFDLPGAGTPVLFVHGLGCASSFDYPRAAASEHLAGHRRILVDLLGFGYSDKPAGGDFSLARHADTLAALVRSLKLKRLTIVGHSMGGAVAILLADRIRDRVKALVLTEANLDAGGGFFSRKIAAFSPADYEASGHGRITAEARDGGNLTWAATLGASSPRAVHAGASDLVRGQTPSWRELLYSFPFPKTYLFGENSLPDPDQAVLAQNGVTVGVIPGAGHNLAHENPEGLARAVAEVLDPSVWV